MNRSLPTLAKNNRRGVTLVELLVVMGLIGFLASMVTYALLGAQNDARTARTRGTITKLNDIILTQWEEYRYRPVDMRRDSFRLVGGSIPGRPPFPRVQAQFRTLILRDTMRMEMPDRVTDLLFGPSHYIFRDNIPPASPLNEQLNSFLNERAYPQRFAMLYSALYQAVHNSTHPEIVTARTQFQLVAPHELPFLALSSNNPPVQKLFAGDLNDGIAAWTSAVSPGELLYLIVANSNYGGMPALEYFRPSEIGDPDGDGLLEFVDAWGNPIHWIRWPAGYPSDLNLYSGTDAMDPLRTDPRNSDSIPELFRPRTIVPLIVSAGPDQELGLMFRFHEPTVHALLPHGSDPFVQGDDGLPGGPFQIGAKEFPDLATDNITNHDIILGP